MIYIAGDKHGFKAITFVVKYLKKKNIPFSNLGVQKKSEDISLEEMIPKVISKLKKRKTNKAILSCGTGIGVEVGANKFKGVRACLATNETIAEWAVVYDNCNVLCLVGWDVSQTKVNQLLDAWLHAKFDGSKKRLRMLKTFDSWR